MSKISHALSVAADKVTSLPGKAIERLPYGTKLTGLARHTRNLIDSTLLAPVRRVTNRAGQALHMVTHPGEAMRGLRRGIGSLIQSSRHETAAVLEGPKPPSDAPSLMRHAYGSKRKAGGAGPAMAPAAAPA